jgi:hypothetical protein
VKRFGGGGRREEGGLQVHKVGMPGGTWGGGNMQPRWWHGMVMGNWGGGV